MIRRFTFVCEFILAVACPCGPALAEINFGSYTFHDNAFADDATQIDAGSIQLWGGAADLDDALTGFSPVKQIINIGFGSSLANHFQLDFTDLVAVNLTGPDIIFFDVRYSADPYEIAVRPEGGGFTGFRPFGAAEFINTGESPNGFEVWALELELDDFGVPGGGVVDAIQFRALPIGNGNIEGDPLMAAVLNIPEPSTLTLTALALLTLLAHRRRA